MDDATNPCGGFQLQDSQPHCCHACEPNALASGITRMPPNLATPTSKPNQSPTLARSAHSEVQQNQRCELCARNQAFDN